MRVIHELLALLRMLAQSVLAPLPRELRIDPARMMLSGLAAWADPQRHSFHPWRRYRRISSSLAR
jgi:hypothetical protein